MTSAITSARNGGYVKPTTRPDPIYVLGDSHALAFNLRMYSDGQGRSYLFQSLYAPGLVAESCEDADGELSPVIAAALAGAGLMVDVAGRHEPFHRTQDPHWRHVSLVQGRPPADPAIVLSIGGLDMLHFAVGLSHVDDIALPPSLVEPHGPLSGSPLAGAMPFDEAVDLFASRMQPFERAVRTLTRHGFERLALLSIAPPTPHDGAFRAVRSSLNLAETPSHAPLSWRAKCVAVANTVLGRISAATGIPFIDCYADQVVGGRALPGLLNDWLHLSDSAADAVALRIIATMQRAPVAPPAGPGYYQIYVDDPGTASGASEFTVSEANFDAINTASADAFVLLHDLNERSNIWVNRARIARIVGG